MSLMVWEEYDKASTPKCDRLNGCKKVALVVMDKDFDLTPFLKALDLSIYEVAITYPKKDIDMFQELCHLSPDFVLQCGVKLMKRFKAAKTPEDCLAFKDEIHSIIPDQFVDLHHHDEFSIRDGLGTVVQMADMLESQGRSFCCVSNHGSVGGWVKQYKTCRERGIKAIFSMEAYITPVRTTDPEEKKKQRSCNHLMLIAGTEEGYYNIIRMHNDAQLNGFYYTPRLDMEACKKWGKGVFATSACYSGQIPKLLMADKYEEAKEAWQVYEESFDRFYIELSIIEHEDQRECNQRLIKFAQDVGAPMILGADSHYLFPEHDDTHTILMCIRQHKTIMEKMEKDDAWTFDVGNLFSRNANQARSLFKNGFVEKGTGTSRPPFEDEVFTKEVFEEAMANTRRVAVDAEVIEMDSSLKLPKLYEDGDAILKQKSNEGFVRRGLDKKPNVEEYIERLKREYQVITKLGWGDYLLINEKIITMAKAAYGDWSVGLGRGSAAGCLIAYCLGITDVDPVEWGLLFERFIDEDRQGISACPFEA